MYEYAAIISRVIDGDTVEADIDLGFKVHVKERFRILNLDTPEIFHPSCPAEREHGKKAKAMAEKILLGKKVRLKTGKEQGKYGRWLAQITTTGGDYATEMKRRGFQKRTDYDSDTE